MSIPWSEHIVPQRLSSLARTAVSQCNNRTLLPSKPVHHIVFYSLCSIKYHFQRNKPQNSRSKGVFLGHIHPPTSLCTLQGLELSRVIIPRQFRAHCFHQQSRCSLTFDIRSFLQRGWLDRATMVPTVTCSSVSMASCQYGTVLEEQMLSNCDAYLSKSSDMRRRSNRSTA